MIVGVAATSLTFVALLISVMAYFVHYMRKEQTMLTIARLAFYTASILIAFQSALLMWGILTHHFEWTYVFSYSSTDLNLYYLISTFWAGQEGTFLLWILMGSLYGVYIVRNYKEEEPLVMGFMNLISAFIVMILIKKNPFAYVWQVNSGAFAPGVIPMEGTGLNPLLQDPWMTIHPPILFLGYSSTAILFAFAISALIKKNFDNWIKPVYPFALFVGVTLGAGIILGGYWAYTTLGWGGFWAWDPVENSSLIPWLTSLALIHGIVIQRRQGGVKKTNIFLALITLILVLYSTFLTRSGVLTDFSVHSFGASELNLYLSGFILFFLVIALFTFILRANEVKSEKVQSALFSRESFILFGVLLLLIFAILTLIGTSSPILTGLFGTPSNVSIDFYNTLAGPLAILMALLIALAPRMTWKRNSQDKLKGLVWHIAASILLGAISWAVGMRDFIPLAITTLSFFVIIVNLEIVLKMMQKKNYKFGGYLTHFGLGLMLIGIVTSSVYDTSKRVTLPLNTPTQVLGYELEFNGKIPSKDGRDMVSVLINQKEALGKYFWSDYSRAYMIGPAVRNTLMQDLYVSPIQIIPSDKSWSNTTDLELKKGEPVNFEDYILHFEKYDMGDHSSQAGDIHLAAIINVMDKDGKTLGTIKPSMTMNGQKRDLIPAELPDKKHQLFIKGINVETNSIKLAISHSEGSANPYAGKELLAAEVSIKPFINLLWIGTVLLVIGFSMAMLAQRKKRAVPIG